MYNANYLKQKAIEWLKYYYPSSNITTELSISSYGKTSIDVASINEDKIIGIEIKGDGDNTSRLELQGPAYSLSLQKIFLLCSPSLEEKCFKKYPDKWGWGFLRIENNKIKTKSNAIDIICNSPEMLSSMLWTYELKELCDSLNISVKRKDNKKYKPRREDYIYKLVEDFPLPKLRKEICKKLYNRKWDLTEKKIY